MPVYTSIQDADELQRILQRGERTVILRFTAGWCGPCKRIEPVVNVWLNKNAGNVDFYNLDVDANSKIYAFLKSKKRVNGIPALLCYKKSNASYIPDEFVMGGSTEDVKLFFNRCMAL